MKIKTLILMTIFSSSTCFAGDGDDFLDAFNDGGWGTEYETSGQARTEPATTNANTDVQVSTSTLPDAVCTRDKQTSIPQRSFEKLLSKRKIVPSHNSSTGEMTFDGGMMIGNCKNMLQYNFSQPTDGRPYLLQVEIKKPNTGCSEDPETGKTLCEYQAYTATDGIPDTKMKTVKVEPNYYGFIQCMRDVGVMNGNAMVKGKIAPLKFMHKEKNAHQTAGLWFYCTGPECARQSKQKKSNKEENSCRHYEDINKADGTPFTAYSQADVDYNNLEAEFNSICRSGNYKLIERNLPKFTEFQFMYDILTKVRDEILTEKVKQLKKALSNKNLSKLDSGSYFTVLQDYYTRVILPKKKQILELAEKLDNMPDGKARKEAQKQLNAMTKALRKLAIFKQSDYETMQDFAKKAPLHEEDWRNAALQAYLIGNIAHNVSRYNPAYAKKHKLENVDTVEVNELIKDAYNYEQEKMDKIGELANDKDGRVSYAREYKEQADNIRISHANTIATFQEDMAIEQQYYNQMVQQGQCPPLQQAMQMGQYQINHSCNESLGYLQSSSGDMQYVQSPDYMNNMYGQIESTMGMSQTWASIEAQRNAAYGIDPRAYAGNQSVNPAAFRTPTYSTQMQEQYNRMRNGSNVYPANPNNSAMSNAYALQLQQQALANQQQFGQQTWGQQRNPAGNSFFPNYSTQGNWQLQSRY
jgi:hypothetical protein